MPVAFIRKAMIDTTIIVGTPSAPASIACQSTSAMSAGRIGGHSRPLAGRSISQPAARSASGVAPAK